jgi:hypothetical protein
MTLIVSKRTRKLSPLFALVSLGAAAACSVEDLKFVPDSELQAPDEGDAGETSSGGSNGKAGGSSKAGTSSNHGGGGSSAAGAATGGTNNVAGLGGVGGIGAGGMPPLGGAGGTGMAGMPQMCPGVRAPRDQPLIDDFEDGNAGLPNMPMMGGRAGGWYVVSDGTMGGMVMPPADPNRPPNPDKPGAPMNGVMTSYALHLGGYGFKKWGVTVATSFSNVPGRTLPCPYDVSAFGPDGGIRFYIKGNVFDKVVRFGLRTQETTPVADGGFCDPDKMLCYDVHSSEITVPAGWTQISVPFSKLRQLQGSMMGLNLAHVIGIEFAVHGMDSVPSGTCPDPGGTCAFDFWVDQIEFF